MPSRRSGSPIRSRVRTTSRARSSAVIRGNDRVGATCRRRGRERGPAVDPAHVVGLSTPPVLLEPDLDVTLELAEPPLRVPGADPGQEHDREHERQDDHERDLQDRAEHARGGGQDQQDHQEQRHTTILRVAAPNAGGASANLAMRRATASGRCKGTSWIPWIHSNDTGGPIVRTRRARSPCPVRTPARPTRPNASARPGSASGRGPVPAARACPAPTGRGGS